MEEKEDESIPKLLNGIFEILGWLIVAFTIPLLVRSYVIYVCWNWFAVPAGAPVLGFWHVPGLAFLVHLAVVGTPKRASATRKQTTAEVVSELRGEIGWSLLISAISLGFAWCYHTFMGLA